MENEKFQELVLEKLGHLTDEVGRLSGKVDGIDANVKALNHKMDAVYEQTAGLTEFKTDISGQVARHELDIMLLKRAVAK